MPGVIALCRIGLDADIDGNARAAQARMAGARYFGIGILKRQGDPRNAGGNNGVSAWRRLAMMRARLECHKHRRAACRRAGSAQSLDLGVRAAARLRPATADNLAIFDDHPPHSPPSPTSPPPPPPP